jgi:CHAD domain-containing protein
MSDGKWMSGMTSDTPAVVAAQAVLTARFEVVRHYLPLAVGEPYKDREHVHQLRVGTRRAAAALKGFSPLLPKKRFGMVKRYLRMIRQAAGDARDWDVFLEDLPTSRPLATPTGKPALDFLLGYALAGRSTAQARLVAIAADIGSEFSELSSSLAAHVQEVDRASALGTFGDLAQSYLIELFTQFGSEVEAVLGSSDDVTQLHRLRIRAKRLRYAIEIVAECFAPPLRSDLYPALEEIQATLGAWRDATIRMGRLEGIREQAQAVTPGDWVRLRPGLTGLIRSLRAKRTAAQQKFGPLRLTWANLTTAYPLEALRLTTQLA